MSSILYGQVRMPHGKALLANGREPQRFPEFLSGLFAGFQTTSGSGTRKLISKCETKVWRETTYQPYCGKRKDNATHYADV